MYQIDNSTAVTTIPAPSAAGSPGFFTDGNPATGTAATILPAEFMNMIMMENLNVLSAAGIAPLKGQFNQLALAISKIVSSGTSWDKITGKPTTLSGYNIAIASQAEAEAASENTKPMTALRVGQAITKNALAFAPVQQGGGPGQSTNKINIGWDNSTRLKVAIDGQDKGAIVFDSTVATETTVGVSRMATVAEAAAGTSTTVSMSPARVKQLVDDGKLSFTPVQQGGGPGQNSNKVNLGWDNSRFRVAVDGLDKGPIVLDSSVPTETTVGVTRVATNAEVDGFSSATLLMTPAKVQRAIANRPIGDNCTYVGFASGSATSPYLRHTTEGVIGIAPLESPSFTGSPRASTQGVAAIDTSLANTAFVYAALDFRTLGRGQAWADVASARALATVYTNTTSRPICVAVTITDVAGAGNANITVQGLAVQSVSHGSNNFGDMFMMVIVPSGHTYRADSSRPISRWIELR